jgi:hypothetical protein
MSAATDLQRYTTSCAERRLCDACAIEYSGPIRAVSQLLWSEKDREEWFSLRENHEKAYRFGLHQLRNCSRAAASAATGNHINRGRFSFAGGHHPIRRPRFDQSGAARRPQTR